MALVAALLALFGAGLGGYTLGVSREAQRAASQAVEASVVQAQASQKRDSLALSERGSRLTKPEPAVATLRGWSGGLRADQKKGGPDGAETDEAGRGCDSDPWASGEYLRVLHDAVRAGNQAVGSSGDVLGAVQGTP